jgi:two-component system sensor histidine kinase/response regulator
MVSTGSLDGVAMHGAGHHEAIVERPAVQKGQWQFRQQRVLVVDDGKENRDLVTLVLRKAGLQVECAENGKVGVDMAMGSPFDLILMDMQMPVMDGLEATRRILALPGRERTPIIALTANAFAENRADCLAAGMVDHLSKPVDQAALHRSLARWLSAEPPPADRRPPPERAGKVEAEAKSEGEAATADELAVDNGLIAALAADDGFDSACGLAALGGRADKYALLLRKYLEVHDGTVAAIGNALAIADPARARRLAHTLKGTAATLGLPATSRAAADLERALADTASAAVDEQLQQLADVHRRQTDTLRLALAAAGAP